MNAMIVGLGALAIAAAMLGALWLVHFYIVRAARKALAAYKDQVVALSDKIDALKERHKILPFYDKDFVAPMAGETLAAYNDVAQRLEQHRQQWLQLMDAWEQSQELLDSERLLGFRRASEARRKLKAAAAPSQTQALLNDCEAPLDRIEQAHENIQTDVKSFDQEDQQIGSQLELLTAASLSIEAYQPGRAAAGSLVRKVQELLPADPLAALRCVTEGRGKISDLHRLVAKILEHSRAARELATRLGDIQEAARQRRLQGFLLQEAGANPDPALAEATRQQAAAQGAMNQANEAAAGAAIARMRALTEEASQGMERHVAAKTRCQSEIPKRRSDAQRLADLLALARGQEAELARDFSADSWRQVAENARQAHDKLSSAQAILADVAHHAGDGVQQYLTAAELLDRAADHHQHVETQLVAVGKRLRELWEQRSACQPKLEELRHLFDRVERLLLSHSADRAAANERLRSARVALERVVHDSRLPRADWNALTNRAAEVHADLNEANRLARQDIELSQQAAAEISETQRVIVEARGFREAGFTPDVSAAESLLAQARASLAASDYEEAIRLANNAEQAARAAHNNAIASARRHAQQLQMQQLAQPAAAAASLPAEAPLEEETDAPELLRAREV